jgi:DNA-directed RNA polymerase specialized sigma24 family protein
LEVVVIGVSNNWTDNQNKIIKKLRNYRSMVANYQACKDLYDQLFPSGTQVLSDMPKTHSDTYEPERWADKRWSQSERMKRSLDDMREELEEVVAIINLVDGNYNSVLIRRYMLNESWEAIAIKMNCDRTTAWRWHNKAIEIITKVATSCNISSC